MPSGASVGPFDRLQRGEDVVGLTLHSDDDHGIQERRLLDRSERSGLVEGGYRLDPTAGSHLDHGRFQMVPPGTHIRAEPDRNAGHVHHSWTGISLRPSGPIGRPTIS